MAIRGARPHTEPRRRCTNRLSQTSLGHSETDTRLLRRLLQRCAQPAKCALVPRLLDTSTHPLYQRRSSLAKEPHWWRLWQTQTGGTDFLSFSLRSLIFSSCCHSLYSFASAAKTFFSHIFPSLVVSEPGPFLLAKGICFVDFLGRLPRPLTRLRNFRAIEDILFEKYASNGLQISTDADNRSVEPTANRCT